MTAPSPRDKLRAAAAEIAAILGWPIPDEIDLKYRGRPPLSVNMAENPIHVRKKTELKILETLSDRRPRTRKELATETGLSSTGVYNATRVLVSTGEIRETKDGFIILSEK
jgi:hypothetical protein